MNKKEVIKILFNNYKNTIDSLNQRYLDTNCISIELFNGIRTSIDIKFRKSIEEIVGKMFCIDGLDNDNYDDIKVTFNYNYILEYYKKEFNLVIK